MGRPKNSTRARGINIPKTTTHECYGVVEDRAPIEARNSKKVLEVIEEMSPGLVIKRSGRRRGLVHKQRLIICLDRGDKDDIHPQIPTDTHTS